MCEVSALIVLLVRSLAKELRALKQRIADLENQDNAASKARIHVCRDYYETFTVATPLPRRLQEPIG